MTIAPAAVATILRSAILAVPLLLTASQGRAADMNVTNDLNYRWGEHQIAVNPKDPKNILYVTVGLGNTKECQQNSTDCKTVLTKLLPGLPPLPQLRGLFENQAKFSVVAAYRSVDGGKTWTRTVVPVAPADHPDLLNAGDPSVTVTPDGTFYVSFDANNWGTPENSMPNAGVGVTKSTDGGKTWSTPHLTGTPTDGPKITADPNTGTIYAASSTVLGPHSTGDAKAPVGTISDRWLASSKDGVHWTEPHPIGGFSPIPMAAQGVFAAAFKTAATANMFGGANNELCGTTTPPCVIFETTKDAGATWSRHMVPVPNLKADVGPLPGDQPMVAADPSKAGHFAVAVSVDGKEYDVYLTNNSGETWSKPVVVTDDATKKHYHGAMAFSRQGTLGIMWRTQQPVPGAPPAPAGLFGGLPIPYNAWAVISKDGGATFSAPLKVSTVDSPAPEAGMLGNIGDDYSAIAIEGDMVYVGWADWRTPERQGFMNALKVSDFKAK